jgi:hypothetical protein
MTSSRRTQATLKRQREGGGGAADCSRHLEPPSHHLDDRQRALMEVAERIRKEQIREATVAAALDGRPSSDLLRPVGLQVRRRRSHTAGSQLACIVCEFAGNALTARVPKGTEEEEEVRQRVAAAVEAAIRRRRIPRALSRMRARRKRTRLC